MQNLQSAVRVALLRKQSVLAACGTSNSGLYADIAKELFVAPVKIGPRAAAWPSNEVEALVSARVAGATDDQLRTLVRRLHAERKTAAAGLLEVR
jgi:prophage regulatory protein